MISNDFLLVDSGLLHKIYLLKCYCNLENDKVLANYSAKMAFDLEKASVASPQLDSLAVSNDPFQFNIESFDDREAADSVEMSNDQDDIQLPKKSVSGAYKLNVMLSAGKSG